MKKEMLFSQDRPTTVVSIHMPLDVTRDLEAVAKAQNVSSIEALIQMYIGQGLRKDINAMYHTLIPAVHLFFVVDDRILLLKRLNTGYHDGDYSVPAGHIESNESVITAAIREAAEELGITVSPENLTIVQAMHRKSSRERIDFFLHVNRWQGEIRNHEPEKCETLQWFPLRGLPDNTIPYIRRAIHNYAQHIPFDVFGWEAVDEENLFI